MDNAGTLSAAENIEFQDPIKLIMSERYLLNGVIKVHIECMMAVRTVPLIISTHGPRPKNKIIMAQTKFWIKFFLHWINDTKVMAVERCQLQSLSFTFIKILVASFGRHHSSSGACHDPSEYTTNQRLYEHTYTYVRVWGQREMYVSLYPSISIK